MEDPIQKKYKERDIRIEQAIGYLQMLKEKVKLGDKEGKKYWRERTIERLAGAFILPLGLEDLGLFYISGKEE